MQARERTPRTLWGRLKAIGVALAALLAVLDAACGISGYSLKDLAEPKNAEAVDRATRPVIRYTTQPVPLWSLPALLVVVWFLSWIRGKWLGEAATPDAAELLEKQREATGVYKELSESRKEWVESLRAERDEIRSKMLEEFERMATGFVAMGLGLDSADQVLTMEQKKVRLAGLLLEELRKQAEQLASDIRSDLKSDVNNMRSAYFYRRDDWPAFAEHFVAGSSGGQAPEPKHYVQRMIYYIGAMTRHFELLEFKVRRMGLMPGIVWEVFIQNAEFDEQEFNALVDERFNLAHERKVIEYLDSIIIKNQSEMLQRGEEQTHG